MPIDPKPILDEIDDVITNWEKLAKASDYEDLSDLVEAEVTAASAELASCLHRLSEAGSIYRANLASTLARFNPEHGARGVLLYSTLKGLRNDIAKGRLRTLEARMTENVFSDMLEGAEQLLSERWNDPAAVICGSVLEEHLRKLCHKVGLPVVQDGGKPKKADTINADLLRADVYSKLDQKNVTAWLDLRNKAAHGEYTNYNNEQVVNLLNGVREFIARISAQRARSSQLQSPASVPGVLVNDLQRYGPHLWAARGPVGDFETIFRPRRQARRARGACA